MSPYYISRAKQTVKEYERLLDKAQSFSPQHQNHARINEYQQRLAEMAALLAA